ncbi:type IV secretory protein VirD4 [Candidatus Velamenicoccus archaeovorus]|uniref:Type IV secretory protein VirD4 n=1 Tax=Velamenicoccus archaeovorus TaxID=1930593 RepID=A0A410P3J3_VELA1|nr:TraM recognition domain-containing protein [Candidatus Velamenicoccus archaeovorus]QAT16672.1 type IV secretory protein VirD4 [Candidatus Velamenicoccus archaeovorus]
MNKGLSFKSVFIRLLLLLPFLYMGIGWAIGLNYARKGLVLGPYPDIPVVVKTSLFGSSLEDISGAAGLVTLAPPGASMGSDDSMHFNIQGYFEVPESWVFDFPPSYEKGPGSGLGRSFLLTGSYGRAQAYELKTPGHSIGSLSVSQLYDFLRATGRTGDMEKLRPYLVLERFQEKYPWVFSDTVLLSRTMGNVFSKNLIPYDILGLVGLFVLAIALSARNIWLWLYYLYWVSAYWLARIGFHNPNFAFSPEGWQVIVWSFWHGFIQKEGRLFLVCAVGLSAVLFGILGFLYLVKHVLPRKKRELEDFLKIDRDIQKRKELSIESVEFKKVHYDIERKLIRYKKTDKYFLGVSDEKEDVVLDENILNHHLHVLGSTGSGKTSLVVLPLARQALDKLRGCCFIDFKGDEVFKKYVQKKAWENKKKFYYFSIDPNEVSIGYNPLSSGDVLSKVDRIMTALELIYQGPAGFYSNVQAMTFVELLKKMAAQKQEINFLHVKEDLDDPRFLMSVDVRSQEVKGLLAAISWIAEVEVINRDQLDLSEVIKKGGVAFFALKSQVNTRLAEAIGRMLIIDLKSQAVLRKETDQPYFIFIDEFQNLACSHFVDVISKVRSANLCLVLSNQSRGNLSSVSGAFENAIFTNTATKVIFAQEDPLDARFWSEKTGQTTYQDKSVFQVDTMATDNNGARLDGLRSAQGNIHTAKKKYVSENVFLRLPFAKSVIFSRGKLTRIANHEFLFNKAERDRLISLPFENKESR